MHKSLRWGMSAIAVGAIAAILGIVGFCGADRSVDAESKPDGGFIRMLDQSVESEEALADAGASAVAISFRCPRNHKAVIARVWTDKAGQILPEASCQVEVAETSQHRGWTYRWSWINLGEANPEWIDKILSRWTLRSDRENGTRVVNHGRALEADGFHSQGATGGGSTGGPEVSEPVAGREYEMWTAHVTSGTEIISRCRLTVRFVPARPGEAGITPARPYQPPTE